MMIRTDVKAGIGPYVPFNHNETLAVRSDVKAGLGPWSPVNHNEALR